MNYSTNTNFLIDSFDEFSAHDSEAETWDAAHKIVRSVGGNHIVNGEFLNRNDAALWVRTSMTDDWMDQYVSEQYYLCDPVINSRSKSSETHEIECGGMTNLAEGANPNEQKLNFGLKDAGYSKLDSHVFRLDGSSTRRIVTICFDQGKESLQHINKERVMATQSLLSIFLDKRPSWKAPGLIKMGAPTLSARERDVLCYLAKGMMTAQIAAKLGIAEVTVGKHFKSARTRLGAATREQALAIAMALGIISL